MAGDIDDQVIRMGEKALQLDFRATVVTARLLRSLLRKALSEPVEESKIIRGEQDLQQLREKGTTLEQVPVDKSDLRQLRRELQRVGVDYSILKDRDTGIYSVFFKTQEANTIRIALEKCIASATTGRRPMKEVLHDAATRAEQHEQQRGERAQERQTERHERQHEAR